MSAVSLSCESRDGCYSVNEKPAWSRALKQWFTFCPVCSAVALIWGCGAAATQAFFQATRARTTPRQLAQVRKGGALGSSCCAHASSYQSACYTGPASACAERLAGITPHPNWIVLFISHCSTHQKISKYNP